MTIGFVIHRFPWPSETFISREVSALIARGVDLRIYSFVRPERAELRVLTPSARELMARTAYIGRGESLRALASVEGLRILADTASRLREATVGRKRAVLAARSAALSARVRADRVTQMHAHWPYGTLVCDLAANATGIPYSISVHAHEAVHENTHFRKCYERLTFATFCNRATMRQLLSTLPDRASAKSHLVYHGVDTTSFAEAKPPAATPPLRVLSSGRLTPTKGFDRLIRACAYARARGLDVELTILGQGEAMASLKQLARAEGFSSHLDMPGWVSHEDVPTYLESHHVFSLLANVDFNDGLPNVVLEAMAAGRPVIVSPLPAAKEAIDHGRTGYVLGGLEDFEGFVEALEALQRTPQSAQTMGAQARASMVVDYDASIHIAALEALLRNHSR